MSSKLSDNIFKKYIKFSFEYLGMNDNRHQVRAKKGFSMIGYAQIDLGIAKYHFEIGAGKEHFDWV